MITTSDDGIAALERLRADFPRWWIEVSTGLCPWEARRGGPVGGRDERGGVVFLQGETPGILRYLIGEAEALDRRVAERHGTHLCPREGTA
ncbi:hypothetical protein [Actinomadura kijaniata]|uniref:hypothetical protein n=1 Tax=Actinomadura kijaniata TaxID=46161 RepID=UPI00082A4C37|nr:hypothetical protein [Actinomadura kijaniata]